jgi:hypothetical protein
VGKWVAEVACLNARHPGALTVQYWCGIRTGSVSPGASVVPGAGHWCVCRAFVARLRSASLSCGMTNVIAYSVKSSHQFKIKINAEIMGTELTQPISRSMRSRLDNVIYGPGHKALINT